MSMDTSQNILRALNLTNELLHGSVDLIGDVTLRSVHDGQIMEM